MINIKIMQPYHHNKVSQLKVDEAQLKYVGTIEEILLNASAEVHPHIIQVEDEIVGLFLIDTTYGQSYDFAASDSLGLRGYFIDSRFQGRGYGKGAVKLMPDYLREQYPEKSDIYLTVNCLNPNARKCYLSGGFVDTEQLYMGGAAGPQHIMHLPLASASTSI